MNTSLRNSMCFHLEAEISENMFGKNISPFPGKTFHFCWKSWFVKLDRSCQHIHRLETVLSFSLLSSIKVKIKEFTKMPKPLTICFTGYALNQYDTVLRYGNIRILCQLTLSSCCVVLFYESYCVCQHNCPFSLWLQMQSTHSQMFTNWLWAVQYSRCLNIMTLSTTVLRRLKDSGKFPFLYQQVIL